VSQSTSLGILAVFLLVNPSHAQDAGAPTSFVAGTPTFSFHSDLFTNLHDALITTARAAGGGEETLFHTEAGEACFSRVAPEERAGWYRAVEYYATVMASGAREQI
jgi:hypothetical protein